MSCGPSARREIRNKLRQSEERLRVRSTLRTVDGQIVDGRHGADGVADPALVGAVVGPVDGPYGHAPVAHREGGPVVPPQEPPPLQPLPADDGARGLAAEVGGAQVFDQDGRGAADDGAGYRCWSGDRTNTEEGRKESVKLFLLDTTRCVFRLNDQEK